MIVIDTLIALLQFFGLTQYEARAFAALVQRGTSTAYQVSKDSGVPRARIYDVLDGLAHHGLVMISPTNEDAKVLYRAVPVAVCLDQWRHQWLDRLDQVEAALTHLTAAPATTPMTLATLQGKENVLAFCRILVQRAERYVMISVWDALYEALAPEFTRALARGIHIKGLALNVANPMGDLITHRMNSYMSSITKDHWFIVSIDGRELCYGHAPDSGGPAYYTNDDVHLYLFEDYIWHDVLVNRLVAQGDQAALDSWILPEMARFFEREQPL